MTKRPIKITVRLSQTEAARLDALASECGSKKEPLIPPPYHGRGNKTASNGRTAPARP